MRFCGSLMLLTFFNVMRKIAFGLLVDKAAGTGGAGFVKLEIFENEAFIGRRPAPAGLTRGRRDRDGRAGLGQQGMQTSDWAVVSISKLVFSSLLWLCRVCR